MFICRSCHIATYGNDGYAVHFSGSFGRCEMCRLTFQCHDCHCGRTQTPSKEGLEIVVKAMDKAKRRSHLRVVK